MFPCLGTPAAALLTPLDAAVTIGQLAGDLDTREAWDWSVRAARIIDFPHMWKNIEILDNAKLIKKLFKIAEMNILTERLKEGNINKIEVAWKPFYDWLKKTKLKFSNLK